MNEYLMILLFAETYWEMRINRFLMSNNFCDFFLVKKYCSSFKGLDNMYTRLYLDVENSDFSEIKKNKSFTSSCIDTINNIIDKYSKNIKSKKIIENFSIKTYEITEKELFEIIKSYIYRLMMIEEFYIFFNSINVNSAINDKVDRLYSIYMKHGYVQKKYFSEHETLKNIADKITCNDDDESIRTLGYSESTFIDYSSPFISGVTTTIENTADSTDDDAEPLDTSLLNEIETSPETVKLNENVGIDEPLNTKFVSRKMPTKKSTVNNSNLLAGIKNYVSNVNKKFNNLKAGYLKSTVASDSKRVDPNTQKKSNSSTQNKSNSSTQNKSNSNILKARKLL